MEKKSPIENESELEQWLNAATSGLNLDEEKRIREEITDHYLESMSAELAKGRDSDNACCAALNNLGNPHDIRRMSGKRQPRFILLSMLTRPIIGIAGSIPLIVAVIVLAVDGGWDNFNPWANAYFDFWVIGLPLLIGTSICFLNSFLELVAVWRERRLNQSGN